MPTIRQTIRKNLGQNMGQNMGPSFYVLRSLAGVACLALSGLTIQPAMAQGTLPKRDLTIELRQVEEGRESGGQSYSAGSNAGAAQAWEPQMVQVRNGEKARLQMSEAIPMQWVESVGTQNTSVSSGGAGAASSGASVKNAIQWFDAGQTLTVTPRWPGGSKSAVVEIEVQRSAADPQTHNNLATQTRNTVSTTVTVPLAEWVTIAATGKVGAANTYSSAVNSQVKKLLQIRVMAP